MVITRYMELLESAIKVSEAELRAKYDQENRFRNLEFVRFDPKDAAAAELHRRMQRFRAMPKAMARS